jgi:HEAT repeat protein
MTYQLASLTFEAIQLELADGEHKVRKEAIRKLMRYQRERALEPLLELLKDARSDVRVRAVQALGQLKDKRALEALQALLHDRSASVRAHVIGALGDLAEPGVVPDLHALLKSADRRIRQAAARSLGQLRDPASLPLLLAYLPHAEEAELYHLTLALCDFDSPDVIVPLLALCEADETRLGNIAAGLARLGASSTPVLNHLLADPQSAPVIRKCLAFSLSIKPREGSMPALLQALEDSNAQVRRLAVTALGRSRDGDARKALIRALADECELVRQHAIHALSTLEPEPAAVDPLISCLSSSSSLVVSGVARELERLRTIRVVPALRDS